MGKHVKFIIFFILFTIQFLPLSGCSKNDRITAVPDDLPAAGPPVTRSEVVLEADRYARLKWTMTEQNRLGTTCGNQFISQYQTGDRTGVGYKWGDWTDIEEFQMKIEAGYGTGTGGYVDYEDYPFECVVGISCTWLVSRAWKLNDKYTLCYDNPDIPRKFCEITTVIDGVDFASVQTEGLRKGDAFINDYHTILFIYETRGQQAMVIDSSSPGVKFRKTSYITLASEGYIPIRYDNIIDETVPAGNIAHPIEIIEDALPLELEGNTRDPVSMEIDFYVNSSPGIQWAPEVIYCLEISEPRILTFTINDLKSEGIDNDIFLLSSLTLDQSRTAQDCIAGADHTLTRVLESGAYFLVIDGGNDQPGEYILTIEEITN